MFDVSIHEWKSKVSMWLGRADSHPWTGELQTDRLIISHQLIEFRSAKIEITFVNNYDPSPSFQPEYTWSMLALRRISPGPISVQMLLRRSWLRLSHVIKRLHYLHFNEESAAAEYFGAQSIGYCHNIIITIIATNRANIRSQWNCNNFYFSRRRKYNAWVSQDGFSNYDLFSYCKGYSYEFENKNLMADALLVKIQMNRQTALVLWPVVYLHIFVVT